MFQSTVSTLSRSIARFGRRNGASGLTSRERPLTADQIRQAAPSVYAYNRHHSRSDRYTYIPTAQIVDHLVGRGYGVFSVLQGGSREEDKRGFTKHMIRFRQQGQELTVGGTHPEIVLMAGLFRLVCGNGLIVADSLVEDVRISHKGDILREVAEGVDQLAGRLPTVTDSIRAMQAITLSQPEQEVFARSALTVKYDEEPPISPSQALAVRRSEDRDPTLWNVMNRVQESLVRGGDRYRLETPRGVQRRRTQPANSVDGQTRLNRAVWMLAEEMRKLKGS